MQRAKGKQLQRKRSELVERTFAHLCETGGARRTWLRGLEKVKKRWLIHAAARNLGLVLRQLFGKGTARSHQAEGGLAVRLCLAWIIARLMKRGYQRLVRLAQSIVPVEPRIAALVAAA